MSRIQKIWSIISPIIIFYIIEYCVSLAFTYFYMNNILNNESGYDLAGRSVNEETLRLVTQNAVLIAGIAAVVAIPMLYKMLTAEWMKRPYCIVQNKPVFHKYLYLLFVSLGFTLALNLAVHAFDIYSYAQDYVENAEQMYSEPLYIQIIVIGMLVPICEEIIFRGLIFERASNAYNEKIGVMISSLCFALYHGNLLQGLYAFVFSMIMIYCYKRTGTFLAPVFIHVCSNMIGIGMRFVEPLNVVGYTISIIGFAFIGLYGLRELGLGEFFKVIPIDHNILTEDDE